jgi:hypothetical protein
VRPEWHLRPIRVRKTERTGRANSSTSKLITMLTPAWSIVAVWLFIAKPVCDEIHSEGKIPTASVCQTNHRWGATPGGIDNPHSPRAGIGARGQQNPRINTTMQSRNSVRENGPSISPQVLAHVTSEETDPESMAMRRVGVSRTFQFRGGLCQFSVRLTFERAFLHQAEPPIKGPWLDLYFWDQRPPHIRCEL